MLFSLALSSLKNRKLTILLTVLSISLSITLLLAVDKIRQDARSSFSNTISSADLIVGARTGPIPLLLYSVFRMGDATNNIHWSSYERISQHRQVSWSIPISLGDSHRGFRVIGTNGDYFRFYRYGRNQPLTFMHGKPFKQLFDVVVGAQVAKKLGYRLQDKIVIAHGTGNTSFAKHDQMPFTVTGILAPTGTPVDHGVHVSLEAIEAIHLDWKAGVPLPGQLTTAEDALAMKLKPKQITAFMIGLKSKMAVFSLQRSINQYQAEPLLAILPGVTLQQLWQMIGVAEQALLAVSALVVVVGLVGMLTVLLASLAERRREIAVLRSVGARPRHVILLLVIESFSVTAISILFGVFLLYIGLIAAKPLLEHYFGMQIFISMLTQDQWMLLLFIQVMGSLMGVVPGYQAYKYSLADGLIIRL